MATQQSGTVTKALSLLDEFLEGPSEITLSQLAARTGIHKTTILRLCASLEEVGFLEREPGMAYRLGPKIWQLAQAYRRNVRLEDFIRPLLQRIRDETGESVSYYVVEGDERVARFRENSRSVIRHHLEEGTRLPLATGVVGRVLLAFLGERGEEFDEIRRQGHLVAQGREPHTTSVAVPVLDQQGTLRGGLVVSGPSMRFKACDQALALIKEAAATIRTSFPFTGDQPQASRRPVSARLQPRSPRSSGEAGPEGSAGRTPRGRARGKPPRSASSKISPDRPPR